MNKFSLVQKLIDDTWLVDGKVTELPAGDTDALYIRPLLHLREAVPLGTKVLHSLTLDNNVLTDIIEDRRSANIAYLENLLRSKPLELNPTLALLEQRQKFGGASQALHDFSERLGERFGTWNAKQNVRTFDKALEDTKHDIIENTSLLSSHLPAILYIYHQEGSAESKLEWLSGLIQSVNIPFFQLPFYLAALLFLTKEKPELFRSKVLKKVRKDTKLMSRLDEQKKNVLNLGHDVMLPSLAIFPAGSQAALVFPYIATRDYLLQDFLGEIQCTAIMPLPNGRATGAWELNPNGRLYTHLNSAIIQYLPRREHPGSEVDRSIRRANLRAFSNSYLEKCLERKNTI